MKQLCKFLWLPKPREDLRWLENYWLFHLPVMIHRIIVGCWCFSQSGCSVRFLLCRSVNHDGHLDGFLDFSFEVFRPAIQWNGATEVICWTSLGISPCLNLNQCRPDGFYILKQFTTVSHQIQAEYHWSFRLSRQIQFRELEQDELGRSLF